MLDIFGFADTDCMNHAGAASVCIGGEITFFFRIEAKKTARVRLEYGIDYVKANGRRNRKILQISELSLEESGKQPYPKTHSFEDASTRKHYPGKHSITLIVNGSERGTLDFEVFAK